MFLVRIDFIVCSIYTVNIFYKACFEKSNAICDVIDSVGEKRHGAPCIGEQNVFQITDLVKEMSAETKSV